MLRIRNHPKPNHAADNNPSERVNQSETSTTPAMAETRHGENADISLSLRKNKQGS